MHEKNQYKLSVIIPCFNEEKTLKNCVKKVLSIQDEHLQLELLIVDDASTDKSLEIAKSLEGPEIRIFSHSVNQGKGASIKTAVDEATGDFVAIQDADLEYDPMDLKCLIQPLIEDDADVVFGSRFLSSGAHRVLYFWHALGNKFLTFLSNMFTDLNLTDMETCYKVFKRDVIQCVHLKEKRFGFEPEIVAKIAHKRLRIFEMGISYKGRTYAEGKKIGIKDGFHALYCIFRYNAHKAPVPIQFLVYLLIGGVSAIVNLTIFLSLYKSGFSLNYSALSAYIFAAIFNYYLCINILFRHRIRWSSTAEIFVFMLLVLSIGFCDLGITNLFIALGKSKAFSKLFASGIGVFLNFIGRRFFVFPEPSTGPWK